MLSRINPAVFLLTCFIASGLAAKVSETACVNGNECANIQNSACDPVGGGNDAKCKCNAGYRDDETCVKVYGSACGPNNATTVCTGDTQCTAAGKCECLSGFVIENDVCRTVLNGTCTPNTANCVTNAECVSSKCKCKTGFKESNGLCADSSPARTTRIAMGAVVGSILLLFFTKIF